MMLISVVVLMMYIEQEVLAPFQDSRFIRQLTEDPEMHYLEFPVTLRLIDII